MPMIEARDGTRLHAKVWGEGRPVVLIHGWPLSGDSWDPVANALAEQGFRAIAYDRRGFGRSEQPSSGYDYDTFADDLGAVIEEYAGGQDVALVGFSMGGGEVVRYISRTGGRGVRQAALISSVVPYMLRTDDNPNGVPQSTFDEITEGLLKDRAHFLHGFFKQFFGVGIVAQPVSDEMMHHAWIVAMQAGLLPTLAAAQAFATTDFRGDLAGLTMPTLVIHGTSDKTVPIDATAREVAKAVPQARLIEYDDEAHGVFASATERLIDDLLEFLTTDGTVFGGLDQADPETRQELIDEATRQTIVAPGV
jgi:pimeloyl-ACP methyl ester carboxylesterase